MILEKFQGKMSILQISFFVLHISTVIIDDIKFAIPSLCIFIELCLFKGKLFFGTLLLSVHGRVTIRRKLRILVHEVSESILFFLLFFSL